MGTFPDFIDFDAVKDDLNITGSANDAWLRRRIAGALARMSRYTHRYIGQYATFLDAWNPANPDSDQMSFWPSRRDSVFALRQFPVVGIISAFDSGQEIDETSVVFDTANGTLIGYGEPTAPNKFCLPVITYTAGWLTLPDDLYEVLIGVLTPQWNQRANAAAGLTGVGSVNIQDVGTLDMSTALSGTAFERASMTGVTDPLLGPWASVLDSYTDRRQAFGNAMMPRTSILDSEEAPISTTPPDNPYVGQKWWNSEDGRQYVYYDDGDSRQWVEVL